MNKATIVVAHKRPKTSLLYKAPSFSGNKKIFDTSNIVKYKYPDTNLQLIVDTSEAIAKTSFSLNFMSNEIVKAKPGTLTVLAHMLIDGFNKYKYDYPFISNPELSYGYNKLALITTCPSENSKQLINTVKEKLLNPSLTQEALDENKKVLKAHNKILNDKNISAIKKELYANYNYVDNSLNSLSVEEYNKTIDDITLQDIVNLHKQLIANSQGKAILVLPKETFEAQKKELFDSINSGIPQLKPKNNIDITHKISIPIPEKTKIITPVINDTDAAIQQSFQVTKSANLKENIGVELLKIILGEQKNSRLLSEIRNKQGLSYSTGAILNSDGQLGYLSLISNLPLDKNNAALPPSNTQKAETLYYKSTA